jgi:hypothetical protein
MTKYLTVTTAVVLLVGVVIGIAYGDNIPVVAGLAKKLPGARQ